MSNFDTISQTIAADQHLFPGESIEDGLKRCSNYFGTDTQHSGRMYFYFLKNWVFPSSPVLANADSSRGLGISCFLNFVEDSRKGILNHYVENAWLTSNGGGIGGYWGSLRSVGTKTSRGLKTTGLIPFLHVTDSQTIAFNQGDTRRGAYAAYLDVSHPEILEFLEMRKPTGGDINRKNLNIHHGVCIPDAFMNAVLANSQWNLIDPHTKEVVETISARDLWVRIINLRLETGEPYLFFSDTANNALPEPLKKLGLRIHGSNLCCVTEDQLVVTSDGLKTVKDLYESEKDLELFDGFDVVKATNMRLIAENQPVYEIQTKQGYSHKVTHSHKVRVLRGKYYEKDWEWVEARDLKPGDKICVQVKEGLFGTTNEPEKAFLLGLYQSDGTQTDKQCFIDLWENDFTLIPEIEEYIEKLYLKHKPNYAVKNKEGKVVGYRKSTIPKFHECVVKFSPVKKARLGSTLLKEFGFEKEYIPDWILTGTKQTQSQYLRGLFIGDGTVQHQQGNIAEIWTLSFADVSYEFLQQLQILLSNLGIESSISLLINEGQYLLPDGNKACYRLLITSKESVKRFDDLTGYVSYKGFDTSKIETKNDNTRKYVEFERLEFIGEEDVYCCEVFTDDHAWVCNGIITKNSEIMLPTAEDRTAVCCLSSLNAATYDEWKDNEQFIYDVVEFLDNVLEDFIQRAPQPEMEKAVNSARRERSLGIGLMGFHTYLQRKMVPFDSAVAVGITRNIFKHIQERAESATRKLAEIRGEPEDLKGSGRRNAHLIAVAPNATSSLICNRVSPGIEPINSNSYTHKTKTLNFTWRNKELEKHIGTDEDLWKSIHVNGGSVQHLDIDQKIKDVFKTAFELDQNWIIEHAHHRQQFIDQGQSVNLFFNAEDSIKLINQIHIDAWKKKLKGLYYVRTTAIRRPENITKPIEREIRVEQSECIACEG